MTNGLVQHIKSEESTSIQWVKLFGRLCHKLISTFLVTKFKFFNILSYNTMCMAENFICVTYFRDDSPTPVMSDAPRPGSMADDSPPPAVSIHKGS